MTGLEEGGGWVRWPARVDIDLADLDEHSQPSTINTLKSNRHLENDKMTFKGIRTNSNVGAVSV